MATTEPGLMGEPREIELKLELEPASGPALAKRLTKALGPTDSAGQQLQATYYDTASHALHRRGFALRVRQEGGRRVQTLKAGEGGAGLFDRAEWACEAGPDGPDPSLFEAPAAQALFKPGRRVAPVFTSDITRLTWIAQEQGAEIEIALDAGRIAAEGAEIAVAELEFELKSGDAADLFRLARRMAEIAPLRLAVLSKSERGYDLVQPRGMAAIKAPPVRLDRGMSAGTAFQAIARACLRHLRLNEPGVVGARDVEALHQLRVAMRRLRSAMSVFKAILTGPELPALQHELRLLSRYLGEARNLDVYRAGLASQAEPPSDEHLATIDAERRRAYDRVLRKLGSRRFRLFTLDLAAWIETGSWLHDEAAAEARDTPIWRFARRALKRGRRKLRRAARGLEAMSPAARHRVRIDAKKLRYAGEFFGALVKGRKARLRWKAFLGTLEDLQDRLGELNDIETGRGLAAIGAPPVGEMGGDAPLGQAVSEGDGALRAALGASRAFRAAKPFWR